MRIKVTEDGVEYGVAFLFICGVHAARVIYLILLGFSRCLTRMIPMSKACMYFVYCLNVLWFLGNGMAL